jgi:hypothetical protein
VSKPKHQLRLLGADYIECSCGWHYWGHPSPSELREVFRKHKEEAKA